MKLITALLFGFFSAVIVAALNSGSLHVGLSRGFEAFQT